MSYLIKQNMSEQNMSDDSGILDEPPKDGTVIRTNHMPPSHINVGPFHVTNVPDVVRANIVSRQEIPVVLYEARKRVIDGKEVTQEKYAVMVPQTKHFGIVCAGCYAPNMTLWNISRCVSCRTFAKHLDTVKGDDESRKRACLGDLETVLARVPEDETQSEPEVDISDAADCDLLEALKNRHEAGLAGYLDHINTEDLVEHIKQRVLKEPGILSMLPDKPRVIKKKRQTKQKQRDPNGSQSQDSSHSTRSTRSARNRNAE